MDWIIAFDKIIINELFTQIERNEVVRKQK